ncbi:Na(+)/H(+) antiporter subunit B [Alteromonas sp. ASW11-130]|uniref:Na(+)/H(+) antiporter subunit B n=1 Tax=Alteromonas sp. ASW11-130 TaxID=3015775 RepID=UPI002241B505|nr:Na(+)/H(+) antiporter subunit B [Alteromonas sp. ASW11-130]MCW8092759.1 Na(+)/H(+) antiporter subunit B [Alteromonas sp. ASW11-130]
MQDNLILRVMAKVLIPVILIYAFYVQFHGDFSPGGGFQAGVIFSTAILLYALVFGMDRAADVMTDKLLIALSAGGLLLYAGTGVVSMLLGGEYLNYSALASNPLTGQHIGIIVIELGVGLTVASTMLLIFFSFARRVVSR